jgi:hypothetical protein
VIEHLETELNLENVKDPDDWEWYYGTMSKSELLDLVKGKGVPQKETRKAESLKQESKEQETQAQQNAQW